MSSVKAGLDIVIKECKTVLDEVDDGSVDDFIRTENPPQPQQPCLSLGWSAPSRFFYISQSRGENIRPPFSPSSERWHAIL